MRIQFRNLLSIRVNTVFLVFICHVELASAGANTQNYYFTGKITEDDSSVIVLKYKNKSNEAHCIRYIDFSDYVYADNIIISNEAGVVSKYKGNTNFLKEFQTPEAFIVIPPGSFTERRVDLADYYEMQNQKFLVKMFIPVVQCSRLETGLIEMPFSHYLKDAYLVEGLEGVSGDSWSEIFPEWNDAGFVAEMKFRYDDGELR